MGTPLPRPAPSPDGPDGDKSFPKCVQSALAETAADTSERKGPDTSDVYPGASPRAAPTEAGPRTRSERGEGAWAWKADVESGGKVRIFEASGASPPPPSDSTSALGVDFALNSALDVRDAQKEAPRSPQPSEAGLFKQLQRTPDGATAVLQHIPDGATEVTLQSALAEVSLRMQRASPAARGAALKWLTNLITGLDPHLKRIVVDGRGKLFLELNGPKVADVATRSRVPVIYEASRIISILPSANGAGEVRPPRADPA